MERGKQQTAEYPKRGSILHIEHLPTDFIAYNANTISPSSRWVNPQLYDSLQEKGLVVIRTEARSDKWRTSNFRPGIVAATYFGDTLSLRPDILELRAPEGENNYAHEDPRITLMKLSDRPAVVVSNVEADGTKDMQHPKITTVFYSVADAQQYPWQLTELVRIIGKEVQVEQRKDGSFVYTARPNESIRPGTGLGKIVAGTVATLQELQQESEEGFPHGHFLSYPKGDELQPGEKEGGNQIILVGDGMLLLQHRSRIKNFIVDTGDPLENFEHNAVEYNATAAFIPSLTRFTDDGKIIVEKFGVLASIQDIDTNGLIPKEWRLADVAFTGGYYNRNLLCGVMDAYSARIPAPKWITDIVDKVS